MPVFTCRMKDLSNTQPCKPCRSRNRSSYSWLPAIVVAILPKCPFCVMAYSGAISMCSGNNLYPNAGGIMSYVTIGLALLTLLSILLNQRGRRTWIATAITLLGIGLLLLSQFYSMSSSLYYVAVFIIFFGVWYNGSFLHFYSKITRENNKKIKTTI